MKNNTIQEAATVAAETSGTCLFAVVVSSYIVILKVIPIFTHPPTPASEAALQKLDTRGGCKVFAFDYHQTFHALQLGPSPCAELPQSPPEPSKSHHKPESTVPHGSRPAAVRSVQATCLFAHGCMPHLSRYLSINAVHTGMVMCKHEPNHTHTQAGSACSSR